MPKMKFFTRFKLRSLFFLVAATAVGCWWVTWPDASAQQFVIDCGLAAEPNAKLLNVRTPTFHLTGFHEMVRRNPKQVKIEFRERTLADIILGRRTCVVTGDRGRYRFWVARGAIVSGPTAAFTYGGAVFTLDVF